MQRRTARLLSFLVCAALLASTTSTEQATASQSRPRIVAVGDIHGALDPFVAILKRAALIDDQRRWVGGRATLVQTGDFTDRGAHVRQVMDLLMALEPQARKANGEVIALLGNHEVMNAIGDLRDATPEIFATFADAQSEARRVKAWEQYAALAQARQKGPLPVPAVYQHTRDAWMAAHPLGWLEYREALGPKGSYGRWLRRKPIAAVVDRSLFMHAGISPDHPAASVDEVISRARREIERFDAFVQTLVSRNRALPFFTLQEIVSVALAELDTATALIQEAKTKDAPLDVNPVDVALWREAAEIVKIGEWSLLAPEGPLWFRGYAQWPEQETAAKVSSLLDRLKLTRMVLGHTPTQSRRVVVRYSGRVLLIDTGMLAPVYEGRPSALEIRDGKLTAIYPDSETPIVIP